MHAVALPDDLRADPFTTRKLVARGFPAARLQRADLHLVTRGVHTTSPPVEVIDRARAFGLAMAPHTAYSHITAAQLWALPLPRHLENQSELDVIGHSDIAQPRRIGCIGHTGIESRTVDVIHGVRVAGIIDTWCDLGQVLRRGLSDDDLVVVGDEVVNRLGSSGVAQIRRVLNRRVRPRGKRRLSQALSLVRYGVRSPMETRARLVFVRAGIPEPAVNQPVADVNGEWLLEGDLVWQEQRVIGEYQGEHHADRRRHSDDAFRRELAHDAGYRVIEVWAEDVYLRPRRIALLIRVARALGINPRDLDIV